MSSYSQVAIAINMEYYHKYATPELKNTLKDCDLISFQKETKEKKAFYTFLYESTKWYDSYTDVQYVQEFVRVGAITDEACLFEITEDGSLGENIGNNHIFGIFRQVTLDYALSEYIDDTEEFFHPNNAKKFIEAIDNEKKKKSKRPTKKT